MKKLLLLLSLLSIFSILALGQPAPPSPSQYNFFTPAPTSPTPFTVVTNGSGSGRTFYYFIVTHYSSGNAVSPNPGGVAYRVAPTLSGTSYVTITWNAQANATGYDVIRLTTSNFISTCINCLVVSNTGSNSVVDNTNSLSGYTLTNAIQPATGSISLNQFGQFNFNPSTTNLPTGSIANTTSVLKGNGSGGAVAALAADIVALFSGCSGIQYLGADGGCHSASGGGGTVTSVSSNNISPLFNVSVNTPTTTPAFIFVAPQESGNIFYASPANGSLGEPDWRNLVLADLPGSIPNSKLANPATTVNGQTCTLGSTCTVTAVPSGSASGDISGTYPGPITVSGLNTVPFCSGFTPTTGQALTYSTALSPNPCYTATTSGGGTPAGSYSQYQYNNAGSFGAVTNTGPVPSTGWTPVNFSTWANVNDFAGNNIELSIGNNTTLNNVLYCRALSSTPYTAIMQLDINPWRNNGGVEGAGIGIYDGTKFEVLENLFSVAGVAFGSIRVQTFTNVTATGTSLTSLTDIFQSNVTFKVTDNGVNRVWSYWVNGSFTSFFSESSGTFLTPNNICMFGFVYDNVTADYPTLNSNLKYLCVANATSCNGL
jgi:hypothetical protein